MRALERAIAGAFGDPSEYGIPDPPAAQMCRLDRGGVALSAGSDDPFITADQLTKICR